MISCLKKNRIMLKGNAKTAFRREVFEHFRGICQGCGRYVPLKGIDGNVDIFSCGHVCHIKSVGAGGHDILSNVLWKCFSCHIVKEHGPKWSTLK